MKNSKRGPRKMPPSFLQRQLAALSAGALAYGEAYAQFAPAKCRLTNVDRAGTGPKKSSKSAQTTRKRRRK